MPWLRLSTFILLLAALGGCGLSHYEQQMTVEQARMARVEEENKALGDPLQLPDKKGRPAVFLRPPLGISATGLPHENSVLQRFGLQTGASSPFHTVSLGAETMKADDFWASLLHSFPGKTQDHASLLEKDTPGGGKLRFKQLVHEDGQYVTVAFVSSQGDMQHEAVVFRLDRARRDAAADNLMEMSLGTLAVGQEAARLHRAYQERKKQTTPASSKRKETGS